MELYEGMGTADISSMHNEEALNSFFWMNNPLSLSWHMVAMEFIYLLCLVLIVIHATRCYRSGDRTAPFTLFATVVYGFSVEALAATQVDNFWHGEFTFMLCYNRIPLYIVASYTLIYFAVKTVQRFRMSTFAEAFAVGLLMLSIDFMWENFGPQLGWWVWSDVEPSVAIRWWDSPVSCHMWQLLFSAAFALMNRNLIEEWGDKHRSLLALFGASIGAGLATVVIGALLLTPMRFMHELGTHLYAIFWIAIALAFVVRAKRARVATPDALLFSIPALLAGFYAVVFLAVYAQVAFAAVAGQVATILVGMAGLIGIVACAHRRSQTAAPSP